MDRRRFRIAKKLEEIYFPMIQSRLHINKKSPGLMLLQQIRDEAIDLLLHFID